MINIKILLNRRKSNLDISDLLLERAIAEVTEITQVIDKILKEKEIRNEQY